MTAGEFHRTVALSKDGMVRKSENILSFCISDTYVAGEALILGIQRDAYLVAR